jgi:hypothetical protein
VTNETCTDACETCEAVVLRTYRELRQRGSDDRSAFHAAVRVMALRHPERSMGNCVQRVAAWLSAS